jgi:hypothetical protein
MISDENRRDVEQLGPSDLRKRLDVGIYYGQKQIEADEWLKEKAHGTDRALIRQQNSHFRTAGCCG